MYSKSFGVTVSSRVLQVFQNLTGISLPPLLSLSLSRWSSLLECPIWLRDGYWGRWHCSLTLTLHGLAQGWFLKSNMIVYVEHRKVYWHHVVGHGPCKTRLQLHCSSREPRSSNPMALENLRAVQILHNFCLPFPSRCVNKTGSLDKGRKSPGQAIFS